MSSFSQHRIAAQFARRPAAIVALALATALVSPAIVAHAGANIAGSVRVAQATTPPTAPGAMTTPGSTANPTTSGSMANPSSGPMSNPSTGAMNPAAGAMTNKAEQNKPENVEMRIAALKAQLKITPAEEFKWSAVAATMRENAAKMEKMVTDAHNKMPQGMTALDDMQNYERFQRAHVDGLKKLNAHFKVLYEMMPAEQKKNTDAVFQNFGRQPANAPTAG